MGPKAGESPPLIPFLRALSLVHYIRVPLWRALGAFLEQGEGSLLGMLRGLSGRKAKDKPPLLLTVGAGAQGLFLGLSRLRKGRGWAKPSASR